MAQADEIEVCEPFFIVSILKTCQWVFRSFFINRRSRKNKNQRCK